MEEIEKKISSLISNKFKFKTDFFYSSVMFNVKLFIH